MLPKYLYSRYFDSKTFAKLTVVLACILFFSGSCKKGWLDVNPSNNAIVLNTANNTLSDYQNLLQNSDLTSGNYLGCVGADDYYLAQITLTSYSLRNISYYLWAQNGYGVSSDGGWAINYSGIYVCNVAIDGLSKVTKNASNSTLWNQLLGTALFFRAYQYYQLAQFYMKQYDSATANTDPGVPLRLNGDINTIVGRGTVQQVYAQILSDLNQAKTLMPSVPQYYKELPTRQAAYAVLAQTYLVIGDYGNAKVDADSALTYGNTLLDFNTLLPNIKPTTKYGMPEFIDNPEVFFYVATGFADVNRTTPAYIDSTLYQSYDSNDLRKTIFFATSGTGKIFRGSYDATATNSLMMAPAVDELYLIRAECYARLGDITNAMNDLNALMANRWLNTAFVPFTASSPTDALTQVLTERRKELVMRGTRWTDLRRLSTDPQFATTVTRIYNGQTYTLAPGSNLYAWPIPDDEILYSGVPQNPR